MEKEIKSNDIEIKPTNLKIGYDSPSSLEELLKSKKFTDLVLSSVYKNINIAINNNIEKFTAFNIINLSCSIEIESSQYVPILRKVLKQYEEVEDYNKCRKVQTLINKYEKV